MSCVTLTSPVAGALELACTSLQEPVGNFSGLSVTLLLNTAFIKKIKFNKLTCKEYILKANYIKTHHLLTSLASYYIIYALEIAMSSI